MRLYDSVTSGGQFVRGILNALDAIRVGHAAGDIFNYSGERIRCRFSALRGFDQFAE